MTWIIERHSYLWTYASFPSVSLQMIYFRDDKSSLYLSWARHHCETHCNGTEVYSKVRSGLYPSQGAQESVPDFSMSRWCNFYPKGLSFLFCIWEAVVIKGAYLTGMWDQNWIHCSESRLARLGMRMQTAITHVPGEKRWTIERDGSHSAPCPLSVGHFW